MPTHAKRLVGAALVTAAAWGLTACPAPAQPPAGARPAPGGNPGAPAGQPAGNRNPAAGNVPGPGMTGLGGGLGGNAFGTGTPFPGGMLNPFGTASMTSVANSPYGTASITSNPYGDAMNPYGGYSYADPYGGGLRGAAEAINAQGKYELFFQRARLLNQQVERSKADTRRKVFDEWLYERANTPTLQDLRERAQKYELRRALTSPDQPDIASGYALNTILKNLEKRPRPASSASLPALEPGVLKQLNLKPEATAGNAAALRPVAEGGTLHWPLPLQGAAYQDEVRRLNDLAGAAVKQVRDGGRADPAVLNDMLNTIRRLREKVGSRLPETSDQQQVKANRFLASLDEAVRALQQPGAGNSFNNKLAARGGSVPDLVRYMADSGLVFGPATNGNEAAYAAVHNYLVGYANALREQGDTAGVRTDTGKAAR